MCQFILKQCYELSGKFGVGQAFVGEARSPKSRNKSQGHLDREQAARELLRADKTRQQEGSSDEGEGEGSDSDGEKENQDPSTDILMGLKRKPVAKKGRSSTSDLAKIQVENQTRTVEMLAKANTDRNQIIELMADRNNLFKSYMESQAAVKEINLVPSEASGFGFCLELRDMNQVKEGACGHLNINPKTVTGVLRQYVSCPASLKGEGQLVATVNQLYTQNDVSVTTHLVGGDGGGKTYLKFSDRIGDL